MGLNTLVSLISVVHNGEKWIKNFEQIIIEISKFSQFEIIIYDDGSKDRTFDYLKKFKYQYRIKIFSSNQNNGVFIARLKAVELASSKFIWYVDFDDYIIKENIHRLLQDINESYDLINMQAIYQINNKKKLVKKHNFENLYNFNFKNLNKLVTKELWRFIIKRDILEKVVSIYKNTNSERLHISLGDDVIIMYTILKFIHKIKIFEFPTYIYRVGNAESSTSLLNDQIFKRLELFDLLKKNIGNDTSSTFISLLASLLYNSILISTLKVTDSGKAKILIKQAKNLRNNNEIKIFSIEKLIYYSKTQQVISRFLEIYFINRIIYFVNKLRYFINN